MKVLQVLNHYLPSQIAGTEVYTSLLANYLTKRGVAVKILIPNYNEEANDNYVHDDIQVIKYAEPSIVDRSLIMGYRLPEGLKAFKEVLLIERPDIVHFQELAGSNGITVNHVELAKDLGFKVIMTFHLANYSCKTGSLMYQGKELCDGLVDPLKCTRCYYATKNLNIIKSSLLIQASRLLYSINLDTSPLGNSIYTALSFPFLIEKQLHQLLSLVNKCDKVVSLTKWYTDILRLNGIPEDKISHIPQALPHFQVADFRKETAVDIVFPIRIIFLGRISHFKGLHLILEALEGIDPTLIRLDIFGRGLNDEYEHDIREKVSEMPNVFMMGLLQSSDVIKTMKDYSLLCLPSTFSEMSPLVIQEAFAAGIPVLASNVYGNAEQIKHDVNGLLFNFNDVDSLRQQLIRILKEPELLTRLKRNIIEPSTFEKAGDAYYSLYSELMRN